MTTLRQWIGEFTATTNETPTDIVFGTTGWRDTTWPGITPGALIKFADVPAEVLDREFDDGYGGVESPGLCAWSKSWVLFSAQYDGSEFPCAVPRHPIAHDPVRPGGG